MPFLSLMSSNIIYTIGEERFFDKIMRTFTNSNLL
jgi:hypothetical protein